MKQQILEILDKSTNNGMKAEEIMEIFENRAGDVAAKWMDILEDGRRSIAPCHPRHDM